MNVAIYGLGRIGRSVLRAFCYRNKNLNFNIKLLADSMDLKMAMHLTQYDSVHGTLRYKLSQIDDTICFEDSNKINYISCNDPSQLDYKSMNIDYVIDSSGMCKNSGWSDRHIKSGAKKVIVTTIIEDADKTVVYGINHKSIDKESVIISNASCTSNALIPIIYILQKEYGILAGNINSIHAYTNGQNIVDAFHEDFRRARAVFQSMIPSTTNASIAINEFFPELYGKVNCTAIRVPIANVSALDCNLILNAKTSAIEINALFLYYSEHLLKNILSTNDEPLVSIDYNDCTHSCVVDTQQTTVTDGKLCRIFAWYNNELAYANRIIDLIDFLARKEKKY